MSNLKLNNNNNNQNNSTANDLPDLTNITSGTNNQNNQMKSNTNTVNNNTNNSNESFVKIQEDEGPKLFQNKKMNRIFIILGGILAFIILVLFVISII